MLSKKELCVWQTNGPSGYHTKRGLNCLLQNERKNRISMAADSTNRGQHIELYTYPSLTIKQCWQASHPWISGLSSLIHLSNAKPLVVCTWKLVSQPLRNIRRKWWTLNDVRFYLRDPWIFCDNFMQLQKCKMQLLQYYYMWFEAAQLSAMHFGFSHQKMSENWLTLWSLASHHLPRVGYCSSLAPFHVQTYPQCGMLLKIH